MISSSMQKFEHCYAASLFEIRIKSDLFRWGASVFLFLSYYIVTSIDDESTIPVHLEVGWLAVRRVEFPYLVLETQ